MCGTSFKFIRHDSLLLRVDLDSRGNLQGTGFNLGSWIWQFLRAIGSLLQVVNGSVGLECHMSSTFCVSSHY